MKQWALQPLNARGKKNRIKTRFLIVKREKCNLVEKKKKVTVEYQLRKKKFFVIGKYWSIRFLTGIVIHSYFVCQIDFYEYIAKILVQRFEKESNKNEKI